MKKGKNKMNNKTMEGIISISAKGTGYVKTLDSKDDIEISYADLNTALHGDTVEIILHKKTKERTTGEVIKIIKRNKIGFSGVLEKEMIYIF